MSTGLCGGRRNSSAPEAASASGVTVTCCCVTKCPQNVARREPNGPAVSVGQEFSRGVVGGGSPCQRGHRPVQSLEWSWRLPAQAPPVAVGGSSHMQQVPELVVRERVGKALLPLPQRPLSLHLLSREPDARSSQHPGGSPSTSCQRSIEKEREKNCRAGRVAQWQSTRWRARAGSRSQPRRKY